MRRIIVVAVCCFSLSFSFVHLNTARIAYFQENDFERAKKACIAGIDAGENNFELYAILSGSEIGLGNWHNASEALISALGLDSTETFDWVIEKGGGVQYFYQAFYFAARESFDEGQYDGALTYLDYAQVLDPTDIRTYLLRGAILYKLDKWEEAQSQYQRVIEQDPENPDIHFLIGRALFESKQFDGSLIYFDNAAQYYTPKYNRIVMVVFQNVPDVDMTVSHKIMESWAAQQLNELDRLIRENLLYEGGLDAQRGVIEQYYTIADNLAQSYYFSGMSDYYLKHDSLALEKLLTSLDFNPNDLDALYFTGEILAKFAQYHEAVEYFERATELKKNDVYAWFYLGVCYTQLKQYEKAINAYENNVLVLDPENINAMTNLAYVYSEIGNTDKSLEYLTRARELQEQE
jgi:tetratricopeptide (TPR) repeat protein